MSGQARCDSLTVEGPSNLASESLLKSECREPAYGRLSYKKEHMWLGMVASRLIPPTGVMRLHKRESNKTKKNAVRGMEGGRSAFCSLERALRWKESEEPVSD